MCLANGACPSCKPWPPRTEVISDVEYQEVVRSILDGLGVQTTGDELNVLAKARMALMRELERVRGTVLANDPPDPFEDIA